jgi:transposase
LVVDLPELGGLDCKSIASLAGEALHVGQSGAGPARAHIHGGRPCVRAAPDLAALSAARSDRRFKAEDQAMRLAGKPATLARIAIARKIIVIANVMIKENRPWSTHGG